MISQFKRFYRSHRIGASAGKTLLWIWVRKDLPPIKGRLGVDLAGGSMLTKRFFGTQKYVSVDIDRSKLCKGLREHPDAVAVERRVQDYLCDSSCESPDVFVCLQTLGTNSHFEHADSVRVIELMYKRLKKGGSMIFNLGNTALELGSLEGCLSQYLLGKFESVEVKFYGMMHSTSLTPLPGAARLFVAYCMNFLPPMRTLMGYKASKVYFLCKKKI